MESSNLNTQGGLLNRNHQYDGNRSNWSERSNAVNPSIYSWRRPVDGNSSSNYRAEPRDDRQNAGSSSWRDRNNVNERIPRNDEEINGGTSDWQIAGGSRRSNSTKGSWRNQDNRNSEGMHYHNWDRNESIPTRTNVRSRSPDFVPKRRSDRISRERSPFHDRDKRRSKF